MNAQPDKKSHAEAEPAEETGPSVDPAAQDTKPLSADATETGAPPAKKKRKSGIRKLLIFGLPLAMAVGGAYFWVTGGRYIETEDAYVQQDRVTVMPQVSGQIASVAVEENGPVKAGDVLFTIDDSVYRNAVEQAQANLESARLTVEKLKAAFGQAVADRQTAADSVETARTTFERQQSLVKSRVASQSALDDARLALQKAQGQLSSADQAVLSAKAALAGDPDIATDRHPIVLQALADVHAAELDLEHTVVRASEPGIASQTARLQVGQYVTPATAVMTVVESGQSWVEANYKETELTHMQPGQSVEVGFDAYPDVELKGTVGSIGAGTGSEFALLPAQNATGNWVKVVQRVPVRIHLDQGSEMPALRAGMSASVTVDTHHVRGVPQFLQPVVASLGLNDWLKGNTAVAATIDDQNTLAKTALAKGDAPAAADKGEAAAATFEQ
ncbi:HlyD family secretion protein [Jiella marina]|uniref:HlyD family secretion protein n=1 Tax=Jiella sp. LLJ827 TaxID=2917712 RepID=UPI002101B02F|nr:HlyD family secretion protein [Jiella sp. LLJ827]MCQ0986881.1 HlyD family secretion protein [Jiella sp. LLJ827]